MCHYVWTTWHKCHHLAYGLRGRVTLCVPHLMCAATAANVLRTMLAYGQRCIYTHLGLRPTVCGLCSSHYGLRPCAKTFLHRLTFCVKGNSDSFCVRVLRSSVINIAFDPIAAFFVHVLTHFVLPHELSAHLGSRGLCKHNTLRVPLRGPLPHSLWLFGIKLELKNKTTYMWCKHHLHPKIFSQPRKMFLNAVDLYALSVCPLFNIASGFYVRAYFYGVLPIFYRKCS